MFMGMTIHYRIRVAKVPWTFLLAVVLVACEPASDSDYEPLFGPEPPSVNQEFVFGVHPLYNPERLNELFSPLMDYLGERIAGVHFKLEASRNYAVFDDKLRDRHFDFVLPNPYQTVNALANGYRVFGKMSGDDDFRGIIPGAEGQQRAPGVRPQG